MVIRFEKRRPSRHPLLLDRSQTGDSGLSRSRLTGRQISHRRRMLQHLASLKRAAQ
jgi:hypothetical protein